MHLNVPHRPCLQPLQAEGDVVDWTITVAPQYQHIYLHSNILILDTKKLKILCEQLQISIII